VAPTYGALDRTQRANDSSKDNRNSIKLTNPNSKFNHMLNFGGDFGSHRHLFGVHETILHIFLAKSWFLSLVKYFVSSPDSMEITPLPSALPPSNLFPSKSWLSPTIFASAIGGTSVSNNGMGAERREYQHDVSEVDNISISSATTARSVTDPGPHLWGF
jgi:hypothetical protein